MLVLIKVFATTCLGHAAQVCAAGGSVCLTQTSTGAIVLPPLRLTLAVMPTAAIRGDTSVSTKDLTESLGWDIVEASYQHDAQESTECSARSWKRR